MERLMPWRSLDDRVLEKQPLRSVFVWFLESLILRLDSEIGSGRDDRETCNRWQRAPTGRKMDQRRGHRGRQTTRGQVCQFFCVNDQALFVGMGARGKGQR